MHMRISTNRYLVTVSIIAKYATLYMYIDNDYRYFDYRVPALILISIVLHVFMTGRAGIINQY